MKNELSSTETKKCNTCGKVFPATKDYFYKSLATSDHLQNKCIFCNRRWLKRGIRKIYNSKKPQFSREERKRDANRKAYSKKRNVPITFTISDERRALTYFHNKCAYCGTDLEDIMFDHWIPIQAGKNTPGTVPTNLVPVCFVCNSSKRNHPPKKWIESVCKNPSELLETIETYFKSLN